MPFTERARAVIVVAQQVARRVSDNHIGVEHIFLGILNDRESVGSRVLESMGVDLAKTRVEVELTLAHGDKAPEEEMVFAPPAKCVIELAFEEARIANQTYIGTEHLLLGVIREGKGLAAQTLVNQGVFPVKVRAQASSLREVQPEAEPGPRGLDESKGNG